MDREDWNRRSREKDLLWSAEPNRFLVGKVADLAPGRALDLGAGEGRNAIWLAERGWRVTIGDESEVALEEARRIEGDCAFRIQASPVPGRGDPPAAG